MQDFQVHITSVVEIVLRFLLGRSESNRDYQNESFGNQNTYAFYLDEMEKIDFNLTGYDDSCKDEWGKAITAVKKDEKTKEQAVQDFYTNVITLFPELSVPADSPFYNG